MKPKKKPLSVEDLPVEPTTTDEIVDMLASAQADPVKRASKLDLLLNMHEKEEESEDDEEKEEEEEDEEEADEEPMADNCDVLYLLDYAHRQLGLTLPGWLRETCMKVLKGPGKKRARSTDTEFTQILLLRQLCQAPLSNGVRLIDITNKSPDHDLLLSWWAYDKGARMKLAQKAEENEKMTRLASGIKAKLTQEELELIKRLAPNSML